MGSNLQRACPTCRPCPSHSADSRRLPASWDTIEDQFRCHAAVGVAAGKSWDLEGHRTATNNPYTWATNGCNW